MVQALRTLPLNILVHVHAWNGRTQYQEVLLTANVFEGTMEEQAMAIAAIVARSDEIGCTGDVEARIVEGQTAGEHQCTVLADVQDGSTLLSIPVRMTWRDGRPCLIADRRSPTPWRFGRGAVPHVDWEEIERLYRDEADRIAAARADLAIPEPSVEFVEHDFEALHVASVPSAPAKVDDPASGLEPTPGEPVVACPAEVAKAEPAKSKAKVETTSAVPGIPDLPDVRTVEIAEGMPSASVMEYRPASGIDAIDYNNPAHLLRQYQVLARPLPLLGGQSMTMDAGIPLISRLLLERFPWMGDAVEAVTRACHVQSASGNAWFRMPPTLLVGPPGSGKSSFAQALAELAGLGITMLDCASTHDAVTISGTPRGFTSATPCLAAVVMERASTANPMIQLDEIEKSSRSTHGYLPDAILGMTEPATARRFHDQCLQRDVDLTMCSWMATANDASILSAPFRSRFDVVHVPRPEGRHLEAVVRGLADIVSAEWNMPASDLATIPSKSIDLLRGQLETGSLRTVARSLRMLWSRDIVENGRPSLH